MNSTRALCLCAMVALAPSLLPTTADAQVSPVGATFSVYSGGVLGSDVAYDSRNGVYLIVGGRGPVQGRFVGEGGTLIGSPFTINTSGEHLHFPRVAYSPHAAGGAGAFLVTWHQTVTIGGTHVYSRIVRFNATNDSHELGTESVLVASDSVYTLGAAVAYSTGSQRFLVVWQRTIADIHGAFVRNDGTLEWTQTIANWADGERDPNVAYNPNTNEFFVIFSGYNNRYAFVRGQRISAANGDKIGDPVEYYQSTGTYITDVAYDSKSNTYLGAWWAPGGMYGLLISANGSPASAVRAISTRYQSYDALSLAYNRISGTYFALSHDQFTFDNGGVEVDPDGAPLTSGVQITSAPASKGNFYPRTGSSTTQSNWLMSTANDFARTVSQLYTSATRLGGTPAPPAPPPPAPCSYSLSAINNSFGNLGGTATLTVTVTGTNCSSWSASSNQSWVSISSATRTGTDTISYSVASNSTLSERSATLTIAGKTHTVLQAAGVVSLAGSANKPVFIWQNRNTGENQAWLMNGYQLNDQIVALPKISDLNWNLSGSADFNLDGQYDLLFQHLLDGRLMVLLMSGPKMLDSVYLTPQRVSDPNWQVAALADMNNDGHTDLVLQHQAQGNMAIWYMNKLSKVTEQSLVPGQMDDTAWKIVAASDVNYDGQMDLLFQHLSGRWVFAMFMTPGNGHVMVSSEYLNPMQVPDGWRIVKVMDFDADGKVDDLFLYHQTNGELWVWQMEGLNRVGSGGFNPERRSDVSWQYAGARVVSPQKYPDIDGDSRPDLLLYERSTGALSVWLMNGTSRRDRRTPNPSRESDTNWRPVAQADFNGDGRPDILWRHEDGRLAAWLMDGTSLIDSTILTVSEPDSSWLVGAVYDVNRDGRVDIVWNNRVTGAVRVWYMSGLRRMSSATLAASNSNDPFWRLVGAGDVNQDGLMDLVWWHSVDGLLQSWYMNGATLIERVFHQPRRVGDTNWRPIGVTDINRDGGPDLIWHNATLGSYNAFVQYLWGVSQIGSDYMVPETGYTIPSGWSIIGVK